MKIERVKELVKQYKMSMELGSDYLYDLYFNGQYVDSLFPAQIGEMKEEDFIEYYLDAGISPLQQESDDMDAMYQQALAT